MQIWKALLLTVALSAPAVAYARAQPSGGNGADADAPPSMNQTMVQSYGCHGDTVSNGASQHHQNPNANRPNGGSAGHH